MRRPSVQVAVECQVESDVKRSVNDSGGCQSEGMRSRANSISSTSSVVSKEGQDGRKKGKKRKSKRVEEVSFTDSSQKRGRNEKQKEEEGKESGGEECNLVQVECEESIMDESVAMTPVSSSLVQAVGELEQVSRLVEDGLLPLDSEARGMSGQLIGEGGWILPDPDRDC